MKMSLCVSANALNTHGMLCEMQENFKQKFLCIGNFSNKGDLSFQAGIAAPNSAARLALILGVISLIVGAFFLNLEVISLILGVLSLIFGVFSINMNEA